jgi:hypothetical protein
MTFALLALAVLLCRRRSGDRRQLRSRHRDPTARRRHPPLPVSAAVLTAILTALVGGHTGLVLAAPVAGLAALGTARLSRHQQGIDRPATAFLLDLLAALLNSGAPVEAALECVGRAAQEHGDATLQTAAGPLYLTGRLLRLGTEPERAWGRLAGIDGLQPVAAAGRRCAGSGARLADALLDTAGTLRAEHQQRLIAQAQRAGVFTLLPLGCCFLPAFVCIGVLPVVIGVARHAMVG